MTRSLRLLAALTLAAATSAFAQNPAPPAGGGGQRRPAPAPTNLKVLPKDTTGEQIHTIMHSFSGDLGVECAYCHAKDDTTGRLQLRLRRQPHQGPRPRHDEDDPFNRHGLPHPARRPQSRARRHLWHLPPRHGKAGSLHSTTIAAASRRRATTTRSTLTLTERRTQPTTHQNRCTWSSLQGNHVHRFLLSDKTVRATSSSASPANQSRSQLSVVHGFDDLVLQPLLRMCPSSLQLWHTINHIDCKIETVHLIQDGQLQRGIDVAFFLVSAHMKVVVVLSLVRTCGSTQHTHGS